MYIGRFAPSPTGALHAGSLVAALASWLDARAHGGTWLVRIEDLDAPRSVAGAAEAIVAQLDRLGLHADGDVVRQSDRTARYQAALGRLVEPPWRSSSARRVVALSRRSSHQRSASPSCALPPWPAGERHA